MMHTHAQNQGRRSVGSKVRVETNGRTNGRTGSNAVPFLLMRSVAKPEAGTAVQCGRPTTHGGQNSWDEVALAALQLLKHVFLVVQPHKSGDTVLFDFL